jgi:hypothetical protein
MYLMDDFARIHVNTRSMISQELDSISVFSINGLSKTNYSVSIPAKSNSGTILISYFLNREGSAEGSSIFSIAQVIDNTLINNGFNFCGSSNVV